MLKKKLHFFRLTVVALIAGLAATANAEWKTSYNAQGNNVGARFHLGWGAPLGGSHQFPRGSGNMFSNGRWNWGVMTIRDMNGDGVPEDTLGHGSRGGRIRGMNCSLESYSALEAAFNAGELMDQAATRINYNRVQVSTDADDLAEWFPEFREGRTMSGDPILHGAETIVLRNGDAFDSDGWCHGVSMEYRFHFLNFAESNNMIYGHVFIRNMSEYIKWHPMQDVRDKVAGSPNGQTWHEWTFHYIVSNNAQIGVRDEYWGLYNPRALHVIADANGVEASFSGDPFMVAHYLIRPPSHNGETMKPTNLIQHGWTTDFGYGGSQDVLEGGYQYSKAYNVSKGKGFSEYVFDGAISPWNGRQIHGWPGMLDPTDARYNQWIWGGPNSCRNNYQFWGSLRDFAPRDSTSADFAIMFLYGSPSNYAFPRAEIANIDDPGPQQFFQPALNYADVARAVTEGGFILPETPVPPALTIVPGDREVTITWSDVNVNTPDRYYYFLQQHPELDPNGVYREYDFEGYRLYRSYVGPSDTHSEKIFECSKSAGNISYFYVDRRDADRPLYRMVNGLKTWYALVPYDKNYDPATGAEFSLPTPESGKVWNRTGPGDLYNVVPRSDASNFRPAAMQSVQFVAASGTQAEESSVAVLAGDGSGKLLDAPRFLAPPLKNIDLVPVNSERIRQDKSISVLCSEVDWWMGGCNRPTGMSTLRVVDGSTQGMAAPPLQGGGAAEQKVSLNGPVDSDGINYAVELTFEKMNQNRSHTGLYVDIDAGAYAGGGIEAAQGGCGGRSIGGAPGATAFTRTGQYRVEWKDAGGGELTVSVRNLTHSADVPFTEFFDQQNGMGWGFWTEADYGGAIAEGDWNNGPYYADFSSRRPFDQRVVKQKQSLSATNVEQFALWLNGIPWVVKDITAMPVPGTVWTVTYAYGSWNGARTEFTQHGDMPTLGDKYQIEIKAMSLNSEDIDLSKIRVVPNPYMASSFLDLSPDSRRIEFVNLPDRCTIRIYSLGGHLVNVLNHVGANRHGWGDYTDWDRLDANSQPRVMTGYDNHGGTEPWNLRNRFGQTVASGLYFYHVTDIRGKTYTGKFYVIN